MARVPAKRDSALVPTHPNLNLLQEKLKQRENGGLLVNENAILAVKEAAARLETSIHDGDNARVELEFSVATAVTHGKTIKDVAAAAHPTALEVLDATDAVLYTGPVLS